MKRLLSVFISAVMIFPVIATAKTGANVERLHGPRLLLEQHGENLVALIENDSGDDVKINREFSLDPLVGSIHFVVTADGMKKDMVAQINPVPLSESSYISLESGGVYGHLFEIAHFERMFRIVEKSVMKWRRIIKIVSQENFIRMMER